MEEKNMLNEPLYFLHTESGDVFYTWFLENTPKEGGWVKISKLVYDRIVYGSIEE